MKENEPLVLVSRVLDEMRRDPDALAQLERDVSADNWLFAMAAPRLFHGMSRVPSRDHLLAMVDVLVERARQTTPNASSDSEPAPRGNRESLALELRALVDAWIPPTLSEEIVETARALLHAEGHAAPDGGWDAATIDGDDPLEDILLWPEGVPALLRHARTGSRPGE